MKKHYILIILVSIIFLHTAGNYLWLKKHNAEFEIDRSYAFHFSTVIEATYYVKNYGFKYAATRIIGTHPYPPIQRLLTASVALATGKKFVSMILILNMFYFFITIFFVFKIGKYIFDYKTGIIATILFSLYPCIYELSRHFSFHFALIPAVTFSVFCLLKTDKFSNLKWSVIFGLSMAIGMNIKHPFIVFLSGPLIIASFAGLKSNFKIAVKNICIALFIGLCTIVPFYFNMSSINRIMADNLLVESSGPWYRLNNLWIYTIGLSETQLSPVLLIVFIIGLYGFLIKYNNTYIKFMFFSWILLPWIILVLMPHYKRVSYITPYLPAFSVISAVGIRYLQNRLLKSVVWICILLAVLQYFSFSFNIKPLLQNYVLFNNNKYDKSKIVIKYYNCTSYDNREMYSILSDKLSTKTKEFSGNYRITLLPPSLHFLCFDIMQSMVFHNNFKINMKPAYDNFDLSSISQEDKALLFEGDTDIKTEAGLNKYVQMLRADSIKFSKDHLNYYNSKIFTDEEYYAYKNKLKNILAEFPNRETIYSKGDYRIEIFQRESIK